MKSVTAGVRREAKHRHYGTDAISSRGQKALPRWQRRVSRLKAFTLGQKISNWEQTVSERDETVTGERGPLRAEGQLRGPGPRSLSARPLWPLRPLRAPQTSCDWHKRPRRITRAAERHKGLSQQTQSELSRLSSVKEREQAREGERTERQISVRSAEEEEKEEEVQRCRLIWGQFKLLHLQVHLWSKRNNADCEYTASFSPLTHQINKHIDGSVPVRNWTQCEGHLRFDQQDL